MSILIVLFVALALTLLATALLVAVIRRAGAPRPAPPADCGDCVFMIPRARVYRRETLEDEDGLVHYLCQKRWIEVTPRSPRCELGRSKTRTIAGPS